MALRKNLCKNNQPQKNDFVVRAADWSLSFLFQYKLNTAVCQAHDAKYPDATEHSAVKSGYFAAASVQPVRIHNSNAKLVYTNTATYATKCEVFGYPMSAGNGLSSATFLKLSGDASTVTAPSDASSINLEAALKNLMGSTADSSGYCRVAIGSTGSPSAALWAKSTSDKYVGGYPTAATGQTTGGIGSATLSATTTPSGTES